MFGPLHFKSSESSSAPDPSVLVCIVCDKEFNEDIDREEYMNHILEHNLIIKDYEEILDLKSYAKYWNEKLKTSSLKEICGVNSTDDDKSTPCYIFSSAVKEDKELRSKLMKESLQKALDAQSYEREDKNFSHRCLFCNLIVEPTRCDYMNHLSASHNLMIGKPDNLVYIDKLISLLESKMESLKCIYCEKVFKDRQVLKEHMRKKMHKRINPKNAVYDQFYMINYISPNNVHLKAKKKKMRPPTDSDNEEQEEDWSDWNEKNAESIVCIFCSNSFSNWDDTVKHLSDSHSFNFDSLVSSMNFYEKVKLVNFIRNRIYKNQCSLCEKEFSDKETLLSHMSKEEHFKIPGKTSWDQPEFFFPTYENDPFLCYLEDPADDTQAADTTTSGFCPTPYKPSRMLKTLYCLFCSHSVCHAEMMLSHMSDQHDFHYYNFTLDHHFVYRVKLIQYLKQQLSKLTCLNCSFVATGMSELLEHMHSKDHLFPPHKDIWDVEMESEAGKETVDYLYTLESISSMEGGGNDVESGQFSDYEDDAIPIVCLFCPEEASSFKEALEHLTECHEFDFVERTKSLTFYDQVKMVTFTRERVKNGQCPYCEDKPEQLTAHLKAHEGLPAKELWDRTAYFPGSFEGDPFLSELNVHHATDSLNAEPTGGREGKRKKSDGEEEDIEWCDWDEEMKISIVCLLCEHVAEGWQHLLSHMRSAHSFDYQGVTSGLPFYDQVKLVNFIRRRVTKRMCISCDEQESSLSDLLRHMSSNSHLLLPSKQLWDKEEYFAPVLQNDAFLSQLDDDDDDDYL